GERPRSQGYVTTSHDSPTLGHPIALGLLERGADRIGERVTAWHQGQRFTATIYAPCFFDAEGERLHA
ncbi:glycine cleavage T C-terminal barrel domain-containing protein, partial [Thalassovita aquimarina]|uniref:glycine cleavage T C-terminal barrel domain-containing protein n=1 Tax=Thalassovita aquimarina TaxID=2785917 RepID=UPI00356856DC